MQGLKGSNKARVQTQAQGAVL